jgi:hypothetical protein
MAVDVTPPRAGAAKSDARSRTMPRRCAQRAFAWRDIALMPHAIFHTPLFSPLPMPLLSYAFRHFFDYYFSLPCLLCPIDIIIDIDIISAADAITLILFYIISLMPLIFFLQLSIIDCQFSMPLIFRIFSLSFHISFSASFRHYFRQIFILFSRFLSSPLRRFAPSPLRFIFI